MRNATTWVTAAALALGVSACGPDIPPAKPPPPPPPPVQEAEAIAAPEEALLSAYVYSPVGKRDPFNDPLSEKTIVKPPTSGPTSPLQKYEIDQLRLQFTITGTSSPMAMIIDREGKGHVVRIGDWVGKNWGKVSHIGREEITVTETIADQQTGKVYPQYIPMRMPKTAQEERLEAALESGDPL